MRDSDKCKVSQAFITDWFCSFFPKFNIDWNLNITSVSWEESIHKRILLVLSLEDLFYKIISKKLFLNTGSLGVNATLSADSTTHINTMRTEMESDGQVTLLGTNYDIMQDSFHVTVITGIKIWQ